MAGVVFGTSKTVDNLQGAINDELHEVVQMYPVCGAKKELYKQFKSQLTLKK